MLHCWIFSEISHRVKAGANSSYIPHAFLQVTEHGSALDRSLLSNLTSVFFVTAFVKSGILGSQMIMWF